MDWIVRPVPVGTVADTPSSLRAKAAEFLRLAAEHKNPTMVDWQQLLALVEEYLALADGAEVDEEQRMRIDALRAEIGLRSDQE